MQHDWNKLIKLLELTDFFQVIERDKNGNPIKHGNPDLNGADRTRLAKSSEDFEEIYNRKLFIDSPIENIGSYITRQKELVNNEIQNYTERQDYNKLDYHLLDIADSYVTFLDGKLAPQQIDTFPQIDLSESNAVQKIIYLNELGIIGLLRKEPCFKLSVNNLANIITAITGENLTTIQPYLNAMINNTGAENTNPYKTKSTIEKVKTQLIRLGFTLK
jgi:hypothetical protein